MQMCWAHPSLDSLHAWVGQWYDCYWTTLDGKNPKETNSAKQSEGPEEQETNVV
jgi:hypothetical protein